MLVENSTNFEINGVVSAFFERFSENFGDDISSISVSDYSGNGEGFHITTQNHGEKIDVSIATSGKPGLRHALNALLLWKKAGSSEELDLEDAPAFGLRGVIEGFYGTPWTHQQRLRGIANFADFNMNTFMVAPKDSPWQRFKWRAPFTDDFLSKVAELTAMGDVHGISVAVCVSPGLSVTYSSQTDREAVLTRYRQLSAVGVKHFGLLFDDISWELNNEVDQQRYATTALAHAEFSNAILVGLKEIDSDAILSVCPMHYSGRGNEPYLVDLGNNLDLAINLFWTGRQILSEYLEIVDAEVFIKTTKRPPFYWDNFPVNDGSLRHSLFIGPVQSRDKGLEKYSVGLLSNPMTQFEMSQLPISTIGEYLWNSHEYKADEAWERGLVKLIPHEGDRKALRGLLRCTMGTCVGGDPAPDLRPVFNEATTSRRAGDLVTSSQLFVKAGEEMTANIEVLRSTSFSRPEIILEIKPWIDMYEIGANTLQRLGHILQRCKFDPVEQMLISDKGLVKELGALREYFDGPKTKMFGDQIDGPIWELMSELGAND
jgi:hyaluronoglucosaminidase